jgi:hypothetical protein
LIYKALSIAIISLLASSEVHAFLSYRFATGANQTFYREFHGNQPSKNTDTEINLVGTEFSAKLNLLGRVLVADVNIEYIGPALSANTDDTASFLSYEGRLLLNIKANPFKITLSSEYFSDSMTPSDSSFGYKTMSGTRFAVTFKSQMPIFGFDFAFYYPFWSQIAGRTEYGGTLTWRSGRGGDEEGAPSPGAMRKKGFFIEFGYYQKVIEFEELSLPLKIRTITHSARLGLTF